MSNCAICNSNTAEVINTSCQAVWGSNVIEFDSLERWQCSCCGQEYFDYEQERKRSEKIQEALKYER